MTILTPEVRALLKRMDADDAIEAAARVGWNAAIEAAAASIENIGDWTGGHGEPRTPRPRDCAYAIRNLAGKE